MVKSTIEDLHSELGRFGALSSICTIAVGMIGSRAVYSPHRELNLMVISAEKVRLHSDLLNLQDFSS